MVLIVEPSAASRSGIAGDSGAGGGASGVALALLTAGGGGAALTGDGGTAAGAGAGAVTGARSELPQLPTNSTTTQPLRHERLPMHGDYTPWHRSLNVRTHGVITSCHAARAIAVLDDARKRPCT